MLDLSEKIRKRPKINQNQEKTDAENLTRTLYVSEAYPTDNHPSSPKLIPTTIKTLSQELHLYYDLIIAPLIPPSQPHILALPN